MDKKNYLAPKAQNISSCDVSNKQQWPKQQRRRENAKQEPLRINNNNNSAGKSRNDNKKPRSRGGPENNNAARHGSGLNDDGFEAELNSVFVTGSKKQNLNHLLNFHFYSPRDTAAATGGAFAKTGYHRSGFVKKYRYNKEQYLQANCQFVVQPGDYRAYTNSPDLLVDWEKIEQIKVSSCEEAQCPICLYPPNSAKMTRCGHVYCWGCLLHYLALTDKTWRKCPICYESIHLKDLKSTVSKHLQALKVGDMIDLELMRREKGSLFVSKASREIKSNFDNFPQFGDPGDTLLHSKLIIANPAEILSILDQEQNELEFQMIENGEDCPESIFVQQAMDLLKIKREEILKLVGVEETHSNELNACASEFFPKTCDSDEAAMEEMNGELIDEDSYLTLNDIEIVPKSHSKNFYYYQSSDGQNIFLHALNSRMLQHQYGCLETAPHKIRGRIVQMESCSLNEDLRKRLKYLQHLPVSSQFNVVEIDFDSETISEEVMESFRDELLHRKKLRQRRDRDERKREKQINEINDRQMGKIISQTANIDIESTSHFPACGNIESSSFNDMLALGSSLSSGISERSNSPTFQASAAAGPSFARMLTHKTKKQQCWPTLSSGDSSNGSASFFGDKYPKKTVQVTGNQNMLPSAMAQSDDEDNCKDEAQVPIYKNSLGDALANALSTAQFHDEPRAKGGKKNKKNKKTVLFSTGMFNGN